MGVRFGAYGKMPSAGDFLRIAVAPGFVQVWDEWLQYLMVELREAMGARFDGAYLEAPIWRFSLPAGVAGPGALIGVLMPSVDRVGRRFPLTLVGPVAPAACVAADHLNADGLFRELEDLALAALEDDMTPQRLDEGLAGIAPPAVARATLRAGGGMVSLQREGGIGMVAGELAGRLLEARRGALTLWSTELRGVARLMACEGLPGTSARRALIDPDSAIWAGDAA